MGLSKHNLPKISRAICLIAISTAAMATPLHPEEQQKGEETEKLSVQLEAKLQLLKVQQEFTRYKAKAQREIVSLKQQLQEQDEKLSTALAAQQRLHTSSALSKKELERQLRESALKKEQELTALTNKQQKSLDALQMRLFAVENENQSLRSSLTMAEETTTAHKAAVKKMQGREQFMAARLTTLEEQRLAQEAKSLASSQEKDQEVMQKLEALQQENEALHNALAIAEQALVRDQRRAEIQQKTQQMIAELQKMHLEEEEAYPSAGITW